MKARLLESRTNFVAAPRGKLRGKKLGGGGASRARKAKAALGRKTSREGVCAGLFTESVTAF